MPAGAFLDFFLNIDLGEISLVPTVLVYSIVLLIVLMSKGGSLNETFPSPMVPTLHIFLSVIVRPLSGGLNVSRG